MAISSTTTIVPILVLTVLVGVSSADRNFISSLCKDSLHHDMCLTTLMADPRTFACTSAWCVARIGVAHALQNASDTRAEALKIRDTAPPSSTVYSLNRCLEAYATTMSYLNTVLSFIDKQSFESAQITLGMAQKVAKFCDEAFATHPNPMTQWTTLCDSMLDVSYELVFEATK